MVTMHEGDDRHGRRPRPVAGLPALDPVAVAKGWLLELLAHRPLDAVASVPVDLIAREAPALCAAIADAVAHDAALGRLVVGEDAALAARAGVLAGAVGPRDVVAAVEALRAVLHRALRVPGDAELAADTGDRLAHVCAQVATLALEHDGPTTAGTPMAPRAAPEAAPSPAPDAGPSWATPPAEPRPAAPAAPPAAGDAGAGTGPRAHAAALEDAVRAGGGPVTLLALELDGLERLVAVEGEDALVAALAPLEEALAAAAGPDARLVREQPGRWWVVAPGRGTDAGRALAEALMGVVAAVAPTRHGVRLSASAGIAVHPDDGRETAGLLAHADEGVFTARALGVPVA